MKKTKQNKTNATPSFNSFQYLSHSIMLITRVGIMLGQRSNIRVICISHYFSYILVLHGMGDFKFCQKNCLPKIGQLVVRGFEVICSCSHILKSCGLVLIFICIYAVFIALKKMFALELFSCYQFFLKGYMYPMPYALNWPQKEEQIQLYMQIETAKSSFPFTFKLDKKPSHTRLFMSYCMIATPPSAFCPALIPSSSWEPNSIGLSPSVLPVGSHPQVVFPPMCQKNPNKMVNL